MRRRSSFACSLAVATATLSSCGYVGDPLPPALNIPERVTDLRMHQVADRLVVEFTVPSRTTEGLLLRLGEIELRAGPWEGSAFDEQSWYASAARIGTSCDRPGPCRVDIPTGPWTDREVFCRVRVSHRKGRWSDWSDFSIVRVVAPLGAPRGLRAEAAPEGVLLTWDDPDPRPGKSYRLYRKAERQTDLELVGTSPEARWLDRTAEFGRQYEYAVEAVLPAGASEARSERTPPVSIVLQDRFPPAAPSGLLAVAGPTSIELAWDPNQETDLAGYFVWRAPPGGDFERISGLLAMPAFTDVSVERGKRYRYAVSAADRLGNESLRSPEMEAELPGEPTRPELRIATPANEPGKFDASP
ncbi:MAG: hypothetical protein RMK57_09450 [Bryobacterales bacterium]|nr:hypothetical protein [Bryobacteraceae bacterium]MDW8354742.1 hypothetical protein [Bryobacterales bacterium]